MKKLSLKYSYYNTELGKVLYKICREEELKYSVKIVDKFTVLFDNLLSRQIGHNNYLIIDKNPNHYSMRIGRFLYTYTDIIHFLRIFKKYGLIESVYHSPDPFKNLRAGICHRVFLKQVSEWKISNQNKKRILNYVLSTYNFDLTEEVNIFDLVETHSAVALYEENKLQKPLLFKYPVILKDQDTKAPILLSQSSPLTKEMMQINEHLIKMGKTPYRRIFGNNLSEYGRLYNPSVQNIKKEHRKQWAKENNYVEIDFKSSNTNIIYLIETGDFYKGEDVYNNIASNLGIPASDIPHYRPLMKRFLAPFISCRDKSATIKSIRYSLAMYGLYWKSEISYQEQCKKHLRFRHYLNKYSLPESTKPYFTTLILSLIHI